MEYKRKMRRRSRIMEDGELETKSRTNMRRRKTRQSRTEEGGRGGGKQKNEEGEEEESSNDTHWPVLLFLAGPTKLTSVVKRNTEVNTHNHIVTFICVQ